MQRKDVENAKLAAWIIGPITCVGLAAYWAGASDIHSLTALVKAKHPAIIASLALSAGLALLIGWLLDEYVDDGFRGAHYQRFLRGTKFANWHSLKSMVEKANRKENRRMVKAKQLDKPLDNVFIGPLPMPIHLENRGTLFCASTGAGKSVAMESMILSLIKRRDRALIVDPNGIFYSKFGLPGDTIFNPFDSRSVGWTLFNEIKGPQDFERISKSIIPPQVSSEDEQWCGYTRNVLSDTIRKLVENGEKNQDLLVDILVKKDAEELRAFLYNTDSEGFFRKDAEKAVASVQFLMNKYVRPLRSIKNGSWSMYDWIHDPKGGNLYLTWREDMRAAQLPIISTLVDTFCSTILSYEPMTGKRIWLSLDELASLGKLESFEAAATKGRKHGLRIMASIQDWAQLDECYGKNASKTLLSCFRNYVIFAASNAYNADRASQILGDHEVERVRETNSLGGATGAAASRATVHEKERLVLDSEISNLPDLTGYIKFAEEFPATRLKVPYVDYPKRLTPIEPL